MNRSLDFYSLRNARLCSLVNGGQYWLRQIFNNDPEGHRNPKRPERIVAEVELDRIVSLIHFRIAEAAKDKNLKKLQAYSVAESCIAQYAYQLTKNKPDLEDQSNFYLEIAENSRRRICCIKHFTINDELLNSICEEHSAIARRDILY